MLEGARAAFDQNQIDDAKARIQEVLESEPKHPQALSLLALIAHKEGNNRHAVDLIAKALASDPRNAGFHAIHGAALQALAQWNDAVIAYDKAIALKPDLFEAHVNRGAALLSLERPGDAIVSYQNALRCQPGDATLHALLGTVLHTQGRHSEAEASLRQAIALNPQKPTTYLRLGHLLKERGRSIEAEACFRQCIALNAQDAEALVALGTLLQVQGRLAEAEACFRGALVVRPEHVVAYSNLLFVLDLTTSGTTESLQAARKQWAERFNSQFDPWQFPNSPDPARRLRVGYVSADFQAHSAAFVFGAMLIKFDPRHFEVFAYSNAAAADKVTEQFQRHVAQWREIRHLPDDDVVRMIREDRIDILVDLSGHSSGNRLAMFARKPAPIQITAWGYITGTGLKAMDALFADPIVIPEDEKQFYAEEVVYLPNVVCGAFFLAKYPEVNALPAADRDGITFGSFNRLTKISDGAVKAWARILAGVPGSRMVIKAQGLEHSHLRNRFLMHFADAGVDPGRVIFLGRTSWPEHIKGFHQVDILLDSFPHCGGVTTLEGLMMGVPVVTLAWPTIVGRTSASALSAVGLMDWIAQTEDEYVAIAVAKAQDVEQLRHLRETLRTRLLQSVVGNPKIYVAAVENTYRRLWTRWCDAVQASSANHHP